MGHGAWGRRKAAGHGRGAGGLEVFTRGRRASGGEGGLDGRLAGRECLVSRGWRKREMLRRRSRVGASSAMAAVEASAHRRISGIGMGTGAGLGTDRRGRRGALHVSRRTHDWLAAGGPR
jgi:hypothetical protein